MAILEARDRLTALEASTDAAFTQLAARVEAVEDGRPCPYIRSSDEGTSYCGLAEEISRSEEISRPDKLDRLIAQDAATGGDSLVERVGAAIFAQFENNSGNAAEARAAIHAVAAWLRDGRMLHAAELLELEANRG